MPSKTSKFSKNAATMSWLYRAYNNYICGSLACEKLEILKKWCYNTMIVVYRTTIDLICVSLAFQKQQYDWSLNDFICFSVHVASKNSNFSKNAATTLWLQSIGLLLTSFVSLWPSKNSNFSKNAAPTLWLWLHLCLSSFQKLEFFEKCSNNVVVVQGLY